MLAPRVVVRPASDDDDLDALNRGNLSWISQHSMWEAIRAAPEVPTVLLVAELDGRPVGCAFGVAQGLGEGGRGPAGVYVLPAERGRGAGRAMWPLVLAGCSVDRVPGVHLQADGKDEACCATAMRHGLTVGRIHRESELELTGTLPTAAAPAGFRLGLMPDDSDEDSWHRVHDLHHELVQDTPDVGSGSEQVPYRLVRSFVAEPWQVKLLWQDDRMVGITLVIVRDETSRTLNTLITGVVRGCRGLGLATAIKAAHARALRDAGWLRIRTQNMVGNVAILASNARLGYQQTNELRDLFFDHPVRDTAAV